MKRKGLAHLSKHFMQTTIIILKLTFKIWQELTSLSRCVIPKDFFFSSWPSFLINFEYKSLVQKYAKRLAKRETMSRNIQKNLPKYHQKKRN